MQDPEIIPPRKPQPDGARSWPAAYLEFIKNPRENRVLKMMPLALVGIIPLSVIDDFLIPFIGVADDLPTSVLVLVVLFLTWRRVKIYR